MSPFNYLTSSVPGDNNNWRPINSNLSQLNGFNLSFPRLPHTYNTIDNSRFSISRRCRCNMTKYAGSISLVSTGYSDCFELKIIISFFSIFSPFFSALSCSWCTSTRNEYLHAMNANSLHPVMPRQ